MPKTEGPRTLLRNRDRYFKSNSKNEAGVTAH
jgi:hypothetical protein